MTVLAREWYRFRLGNHDDVPATAGVFSFQADLGNQTLNPSVLRHLERPNTLEVRTGPAALCCSPLGSIAVNVVNGVEPVLAAVPRESRGITALHSSVKSVEGSLEPSQRLLLGGERTHRHIRPLLPDRPKLGRLHSIRDAYPALTPSAYPLLKGGVV
jgi:hypothetical protein